VVDETLETKLANGAGGPALGEEAGEEGVKAPPAKPSPKKVRKKRSALPTSGQSGPPLELVKSKLNGKEEKVVAFLLEDANPVPINALATQCFGDWPEVLETPKPASTANSWVRNSLRRLARAKWVEKVGRGTYRLTEQGRTRAEGGDSLPPPEPETKPELPSTATEENVAPLF
jgi:hypothetical protein